MKICLIGKYPPIEGGVSRDNFWTSLALARKGVQVHLVTNAREVEYQYRIFDDVSALNLAADPLASANGNLRLHFSAQRPGYVPNANPFVTKLASIATDVVAGYDCDLIYSYYFEPYAVAAHLASRWTGVPYGIRHAGSDVGRLFLSTELQTAYSNVIRDADFIFASDSAFRRFLSLGVDIDKLQRLAPYSLPTDYFNPSASPFEMNELLRLVCDKLPKDFYGGAFHQFYDKCFDHSLPTIGVYGKAGGAKGSFDLIKALGRLACEGLKFNFLAVTQGHPRAVFSFIDAVKAHSLQTRTWLLPFIPHWLIPNFIRTCTAVCFLERDFPIKIHNPLVPREVLACGTCLILSREVGAKHAGRRNFAHGSNLFLVDPKDTDELAQVIREAIADPEHTRAVGMNGYTQLSSNLENFDTYAESLVSTLHRVQEKVRDRRLEMSVAEMQAFLARLYVDDSFRGLFQHLPDKTLESYTLTEAERAAVKAIDRKMLDIFAASLKHKARSKYQAAYPLLFKLNRASVDKYYDRYYQLHHSKPDESTFSKVIAFGRFMEETVEGDAQLPPYTSDLVKFERMIYFTRFWPSPADSFGVINDPDDTLPESVTLDARPTRLENVSVGSFSYDVVKITDELEQDRAPTDLQEGEYRLVFQQQSNSLRPQIFGVNPATAELLDRCDGKSTVRELIARIERVLGKSELESAVLQILDRLLALRLIRVRAGAQ